MDLIACGPNGRLDSMAACKLLWSGAISFEREGIVWDGHAHKLQEPVIHEDVISLYRLSQKDVEAVLPDMLDLLATLERDEMLHAPIAYPPDDAWHVTTSGHVTGSTLFLLQSDDHPLIVEFADKDTFQVRYDMRLCGLIPGLQRLLRRMLCHLRIFRGDREPFTILFTKDEALSKKRAASNRTDSHQRPLEAMDARVVVDAAEILDVWSYHATTSPRKSGAASDETAGTHHASAPQSQSTYLQAISVLESSLYTTRTLADATRRRINDFEKTRAQIDASKPDSKAAQRHANRALSSLTSDARAIRSLAIHSAIYLCIGVAFMWIGRTFIMENEKMVQLITGIWTEAIGRATDFVSLTLGQAQSMGRRDVMELPTDSVSGVLRVLGFLLMGFGIVFSVTRILRYRRRVNRERAFIHSHMDFIAGLSRKQQLSAEMAYSQELGSWASGVSQISNEIELAQSSLDLLKKTSERTREALAECREILGNDSPEAQPITLSTKRSATTLMKDIDAEFSEKERHERIASYCNDAEDIAHRTVATVHELSVRA